MVKVLIIDDEEPARQLIRHFLKEFREITIIGECTNGFEGVKEIESLRPDLLFLDVRMPKITGFEMLELIEEPPLTIFSTAYDEYAIKAFELNAIDYLMKPYSQERFNKAVEKAIKKLKEKGTRPAYKELRGNETGDMLNKIVVRNGNRIQIIPTHAIRYFEADDDYVTIHSEEGKHMKQMRMKYLEENLSSDLFLRIHRSYILNIDLLKKIESYTKDTYMATLDDGTQLPVSRSGYQRLKEILDI